MTKRKPTKHQDDILRGIRPPDRYDPKARGPGLPWRMAKAKDGAYVCYEQHLEIIDNLRKNAEEAAAQSPQDGIHTCSKGCSKPGCNRGLRDTIEEQDAQIVALKQDLLEKAAELRRLSQERVHDLNLIALLKEDNEALMTTPCSRLLREERKENARLKAEVERLRKAGDAMASCIQFNEEMEKDYDGPTLVRQCVKDWNAAKEGADR